MTENYPQLQQPNSMVPGPHYKVDSQSTSQEISLSSRNQEIHNIPPLDRIYLISILLIFSLLRLSLSSRLIP
jgi:hypothetical protein